MFKETEKFIIEVKGIIENDVFEEFFKNFSNGFDAIDSFFEINYDKLKIYLLSKEDLNKVVKEKSNQYKNIDVPDWLVGFSTFSEAYIKIPDQTTLDELSKVALHEATHLISYKLSTQNKRLKLLDEGLAVYLSNQYEGKRLSPWVNAYLKGTLPKVSDFITYDSNEFASRKRLHTFIFNNRISNHSLWQSNFFKMASNTIRIYISTTSNRRRVSKLYNTKNRDTN